MNAVKPFRPRLHLYLLSFQDPVLEFFGCLGEEVGDFYGLLVVSVGNWESLSQQLLVAQMPFKTRNNSNEVF